MKILNFKKLLLILILILNYNSIFSIIILPSNISNFNEFTSISTSFSDFVKEYIKYLKNENISELEKKILIEKIYNSSEREIEEIIFDDKIFKKEIVIAFKEIINDNFKIILLARLAAERLANLILGDEKVPYFYKIYKEDRNELSIMIKNIKNYVELKKNELIEILLVENYEKLINFLNKYSDENLSYNIIYFLQDLDKLGKTTMNVLFKNNSSSSSSIGVFQLPAIYKRFDNQLKKK